MFKCDWPEPVLFNCSEITLRKTKTGETGKTINEINWRRNNFAICSTLKWPNCLISTFSSIHSLITTDSRHRQATQHFMSNHFIIWLSYPSQGRNQRPYYSWDKFNFFFFFPMYYIHHSIIRDQLINSCSL